MSQITDAARYSTLPASPLALFIALLSGELLPHSLWLSPRFRRKFLLRGLLMPFSTFAILAMVVRHPHYPALLFCQPRLPCRSHRPYLSSRYGSRTTAQAIMFHYQGMTGSLGSARFEQHLSDGGIGLAQLTGKEQQTFILSLVSTHKLDREGEASILLRDSSGQLLCELTFTLCLHHQQRVLLIGGLQGPNGEQAQQSVQQATRDLFGLFPKRVVYEALTQVARSLGVQAIHAVSNETHVYRARRYASRKKLMHADYNSFWEMLGGTATREGYYRLPTAVVRKEMAEIASKKRSEYRKRYALFDQLQQDIEQVLPHQPACCPQP